MQYIAFQLPISAAESNTSNCRNDIKKHFRSSCHINVSLWNMKSMEKLWMWVPPWHRYYRQIIMWINSAQDIYNLEKQQRAEEEKQQQTQYSSSLLQHLSHVGRVFITYQRLLCTGHPTARRKRLQEPMQVQQTGGDSGVLSQSMWKRAGAGKASTWAGGADRKKYKQTEHSKCLLA